MKISSKKIVLLSLIILLGVFLINVNQASAQDKTFVGGIIESILGKAVGDFLIGIFGFLVQIGIAFTGFIGNLFTGVLNFSFRDMDMIYDGWVIVRDIVNMFFVLALVVIAFATILRIETYGMKTLLPKILIVALFINFSYLICGIIIDATQIMTNSFLRAMEGNNIGITVLNNLQVMDAIQAGDVEQGIRSTATSTKIILTMAFTALIIFLAGFVLLIGTILLLVRMGALWALIILVPFAWFFSIFPKFKSNADKWWSEFLKWSFFAPIYVFFIYLIMRIANSDAWSNLKPIAESPATLVDATITPMFQNLNLLFKFVFLIILLFGASTLSMSMSGRAGKVALGTAKGTLKGTLKGMGKLHQAFIAPPGWIQAGAPKTAARLSKLAIYTTPKFWKQAIEERKRERLREARVGGKIGTMQDVLNRVNSIFTRKTTHRERAEQFEIQERKQELLLDTKGDETQLMAKFADSYKRKDIVDMKAAIELLVDGKDHNDLMLHSGVFDKMTYSDNKLVDKSIRGKRVNRLGDAATEKEREKGREYNDNGFKDLMYQMFENAGEKKAGTAAFMSRLGEIGIRNGAYSLYRGGKADAKGNWKRTSDKEQAQAAEAKYAAITLREKGRNEHATTFGTQVWDYQNNRYGYGKLTTTAREIFKSMSIGDIKEKRFHEMRDDTFRGLAAAIGQLTQELQNKELKEKYYSNWTKEDETKIEVLKGRIDKYIKVKKEKEEGKEEGEEKKKKMTKEEASEKLFEDRL